MSPTSKVTHWFQASSSSVILPRPESGFVDVEDGRDVDDGGDMDDGQGRDILARIPSKKRKRLAKMQKGNVKTF